MVELRNNKGGSEMGHLFLWVGIWSGSHLNKRGVAI